MTTSPEFNLLCLKGFVLIFMLNQGHAHAQAQLQLMAGEGQWPGYSRGGNPLFIAASENYSCLVYPRSMQVMDIRDPLNPVPLGGLALPGETFGIAMNGSYAYVANYRWLRVVDISDPTHPLIVGSYLL